MASSESGPSTVSANATTDTASLYHDDPQTYLQNDYNGNNQNATIDDDLSDNNKKWHHSAFHIIFLYIFPACMLLGVVDFFIRCIIFENIIKKKNAPERTPEQLKQQWIGFFVEQKVHMVRRVAFMGFDIPQATFLLDGLQFKLMMESIFVWNFCQLNSHLFKFVYNPFLVGGH